MRMAITENVARTEVGAASAELAMVMRGNRCEFVNIRREVDLKLATLISSISQSMVDGNGYLNSFGIGVGL